MVPEIKELTLFFTLSHHTHTHAPFSLIFFFFWFYMPNFVMLRLRCFVIL